MLTKNMLNAESSFDATQESAVVFGGASNFHKIPHVGYVLDEDDIPDVVVHVRTKKIGITCDDIVSYVVDVTGETYSGETFTSTATIEEMVGCRK
jgi:diacylglycerol kinase family enzyme